jgi:acyl-homoserine lactone acylase PvdQ
LLSTQNNFTLDKMIETGYNTHLAAFDILLPSLFIAYDEKQRQESTIKADLDEAIQLLKLWNRESDKNSIATTLAIEWASKLKLQRQKDDTLNRFEAFAKFITPQQKINLLEETIKELNASFGTWRVKWGEMNRYQRLSADLQQKFDDNKPSFAVGMASSEWGCIPSFKAVRTADTKKRYGINGNSFVAAVEFGKRIKAKSIITGGEGMDPSSKHFLDQTEGYINGKFKDVLFYKEDVLKHVERKYHPGSAL